MHTVEQTRLVSHLPSKDAHSDFSSQTIQELVEEAATCLPLTWPVHTFIASNPLKDLESLKFKNAVSQAYTLFNQHSKQDPVAERVNRELIKWCQAFLDEGQATLKMPCKQRGFYAAWHSLAPYDTKVHKRSKKSLSFLSTLPQDPIKALEEILKRFEVPAGCKKDFFRSELAHLPGWGGYIKWKTSWSLQKEANSIDLIQFLAVRLAIKWLVAPHPYTPVEWPKNVPKHNLEKLQLKEEVYGHELVQKLLNQGNQVTQHSLSAQAQFVFCIDVRSEPLRAQIEKQGPYETFGFAGFFGVPITLQSFDAKKPKNQCPALLKPQHTLFEQPVNPDRKAIQKTQKINRCFRLLKDFYQNIKYNFSTSFALVETLGLWSGLWMGSNSLAPGLCKKVKKKGLKLLKSDIPLRPNVHHESIPFSQQILYGESALRMMGLTKNFSPLVIFCGHGSTTENNPYGSSLHCGACGGNRGGPNARVLASILNTPYVRETLRKKGILIPNETRFLAAEHDTVTDEVDVYEQEYLSEVQAKILEKIREDLKQASNHLREFRFNQMDVKVNAKAAYQKALKKSSDWAEVRPEWGLAKNAAMVIGPRHLTRNICLEGRVFLHSYDWEQDVEGNYLETILTAPMVVAEWINMQYLFSSLDNTLYGSGSKITHNPTGKLGIMQGNGSDLMHGLPLQSVNLTDKDAYHEPMRLLTIVYAPPSKMMPIIEKHLLLQDLFLNNWVKLVSINPKSNQAYKLSEAGTWIAY